MNNQLYQIFNFSVNLLVEVRFPTYIHFVLQSSTHKVQHIYYEKSNKQDQINLRLQKYKQIQTY